jgi:two-component system sensor histidine kinase KdpD
VDVNLHVDPDLPRARFDGDALCQILDNLLDNAEKHTRSAPSREVRVAVRAASGVLEVTVSDSGPGIPRHQQRRLFRAFSRRRQDAATPGLGLGLALARSLARAQGGDLCVSSTTTDGATFVLTLPTADAPG